MNWNSPAPAAQTNISNFPFNEREIKNVYDHLTTIDSVKHFDKVPA